MLQSGLTGGEEMGTFANEGRANTTEQIPEAEKNKKKESLSDDGSVGSSQLTYGRKKRTREPWLYEKRNPIT